MFSNTLIYIIDITIILHSICRMQLYTAVWGLTSDSIIAFRRARNRFEVCARYPNGRLSGGV